MTELPDNILHLPQYQVLGCKSTDDEMHFQVDVPDPIACEECGVQGEFVRFGKRDVPYPVFFQYVRRAHPRVAIATAQCEQRPSCG